MRLTQAELGQRVGVSDSYVAHMESGLKTPSENVAMALATEFGLPADGQDALLAALEEARVQRSADRIRTRGRAVRGALRTRARAGPIAIDVFDPMTGESVATIPTPSRQVRFLALSPDGSMLAATDEKGTTTVRDTTGAGSAVELPSDDAPLTVMAFLADGNHILTADEAHVVRAWNTMTGRPLRFDVPVGRLAAVDSSPDDGRLLALGDEDGRLVMLELDSRRTRWIMSAHDGPVHAAAFTSDARHVITGGQDGFIRMWHTATGDEAMSVVHDGAILALANSKDGARLASGGADGEVRLWDTKNGTALRTLRGPGPVSQLAFRDANHLITVYGDGTIITWDPISGDRTHGSRIDGAPLPASALTRDGRSMAVAASRRHAAEDLDAEQIARDLAADRELVAAYRDLRKSLADPDMRHTVLNALRAFARNS